MSKYVIIVKELGDRMIHKQENNIGQTYYKVHSYSDPNEEVYDRVCEYQIIDNIKFEISKTFSEKMEMDDISVKVVKVTGYEHICGEEGYEIRYYLPEDKIDYIKRYSNDGHTIQNHDLLYNDDVFEALNYVTSNFEQYSEQLILSDEVMKIYEQLLNKAMVVTKNAI